MKKHSHGQLTTAVHDKICDDSQHISMMTKLFQQHGSPSTTSFTIHLDTHCVKVSKCALTTLFDATHVANFCCFSHEKVTNELTSIGLQRNKLLGALNCSCYWRMKVERNCETLPSSYTTRDHSFKHKVMFLSSKDITSVSKWFDQRHGVIEGYWAKNIFELKVQSRAEYFWVLSSRSNIRTNHFSEQSKDGRIIFIGSYFFCSLFDKTFRTIRG